MIKFNIMNNISGEIQFIAEIECDGNESTAVKLGLAVKYAIINNADLIYANLSNANLSNADLRNADLTYVDLSNADLSDADLRNANLSNANLIYVDLSDANLSNANLRNADLIYSDLSNANLSNANLSNANLRNANLSYANLSNTDLSNADLSNADLSNAKNISELVKAQTTILADGDIIGWKKLFSGTICKLRIPADARRSNATGRMCRAEYAIVLEGEGVSQYDRKFSYKVGETVRPTEPFNEDRWLECESGIHFFITRVEAENY